MDQAPASIYLRQIKRIAHGNLSKSSLNTKSFYHGLKSFSCGLENQSRVFSLWYSKNSLSHFKKDYISLFERKTISFWLWFSYILQKKIYSLLNIKIEKINGHLYFTTNVVFVTAEKSWMCISISQINPFCDCSKKHFGELHVTLHNAYMVNNLSWFHNFVNRWNFLHYFG